MVTAHSRTALNLASAAGLFAGDVCVRVSVTCEASGGG